MRILKASIDPKGAEVEAGAYLDESHYSELIVGADCAEPVFVTKPDGSCLACYVPNVIPVAEQRVAYSILRRIHCTPTNRGVAVTGEGAPHRILKDGTRSKTRDIPTRAFRGQSSAIIGYYDRYIRIPYCRATAFNLRYPGRFDKLRPFIKHCDATFRRYAPERYAAQRAAADATSPDFVINDTAFSTITVNKNWRTRAHYDAGDYEDGMGVMTCLRAGHYGGGALVFPKYGLAVDMASGGVLLADVHELHGNTAIMGNAGGYERVSCIFYFRNKMQMCGTAAEELERAKNRKPGDPLWDNPA